MSQVSVVIPAYNRQAYISETINSVLQQTYKDFEIIIVDDGSTDNTKQIIDDYIKNFPNKIKYIYQANKGPSAARNRGIRESAGEYVAFLDSDDLWLADYLTKTRLYLEKNSYDLIITDNYDYIFQNGNIKEKRLVKKERFVGRGMDLYKELYNLFNNGLSGGSQIIIKKKSFEKIGYFDEKLFFLEDWDLWLNIAKNNLKIGYIDEPLFIYRRHNDCLCRDNNYTKLKLQNIYYGFNKHKKEAFKKDKTLREAYDYTLWKIGAESISKRIDFFFGLKCLLVSLVSTFNFKKIFKLFKDTYKLLNYFKKK